MTQDLMEVNIDLIKELRAKGKFLEAQDLFNKFQEVGKKNLVEGKIANKRLENIIRNRKYRYANKDIINERWRVYYQKNRLKIIEDQRKRKLADPDKYKNYQKNYRLRKKMENNNGQN